MEGRVWWLLSACGGDDPEPATPVDPDRPDVVCPGDPGCPDNDGPLRAGAAQASIVPDCFESWTDGNGDATYDPEEETFLDCGCDRRCEGDPGWPGADEGEGDGAFQAVWVAGFQSSRPASGVRDASLGLDGEGDGLWATAVVLDQGSTRIGIVAMDAFGVQIDDTLGMRQAAIDAGLELDWLLVHSSHTHASPDVLGIYGPDLVTTGYSERYAAQLEATVVGLLTEAVAALEPVSVIVGTKDANEAHSDGVGNLIVDTRDPNVVDPVVGAVRLVGEGGTVATLVHFGNHPEETADVWSLLTANYVHALRRTVSSGVDWGDGPRTGVGGVTVFLNGTLGGMMTSLHAAVQAPDGTISPDRSFEKADTLGRLVGGLALDALDEGHEVPDPRLSVSARQLFLPVDNDAFRAMFLLGVLANRKVWNYDEDEPISSTNVPDVQTEVALLDLGPRRGDGSGVRMLMLPGEPFPELAVGGYDGSFTPPNQALVDADNPNPPDLGAESGPFLHELMDADTPWVVGLANDQIGYVVPPGQFEVGEVPYLLEADGDHYEETNSLGPETAPLLIEAARSLIER